MHGSLAAIRCPDISESFQVVSQDHQVGCGIVVKLALLRGLETKGSESIRNLRQPRVSDRARGNGIAIGTSADRRAVAPQLNTDLAFAPPVTYARDAC